MIASAQHLQHPPGMRFVGRLAENLPLAFGHGIATEDQVTQRWNFPYDVGGLLPRESGNEHFGRFPAANPAFRRFVGHDDFEIIARLRQQFATAKRATGKDKFWAFLAGHRKMRDRYWRPTVYDQGLPEAPK